MGLEIWTPLEFIDDDLLTLEAAALLSLAAKHSIDNVKAAVETWSVRQSSLRKDVDDVSGQVIEAAGLLEELLHMTGLALPSAVNRFRLTTFVDALREMSSVVGRSRDLRAGIGLLNLACEESMQQSPVVADLFRSGLLEKAWQDVEHFIAPLAAKESKNQAPELGTPCSGDWNAHDTTLLGDYAPWSWGIGPMFQTLGGWDAAWLMSRQVSKERQWDRIRYWTPLPHLALGPLGWSDPALGVARWILMGMPQTTPELSLLEGVWGTDALMYFSHPQMDWIPQSDGCLGFRPRTSGHRISDIFQKSESASIFWGCGELHMQAHLQWQMCGQNAPREVRSRTYINEEDPHKVILELAATAGWHTQLQIAGDQIAAELSDPRIEVTVIAPPMGTLGTFRRSGLTGLWYSGSHEAHVLGHSNLNGPIRRLPSTRGPATMKTVPQDLSVRHTNAAAFWIASEVARRHPHYVLLGDSAEGLRLVSSSGEAIYISRQANVRVGEMEIVNTAEMFTADDQRKLVEELEAKLGLPAKKHAAATTARTLVYRTMAHIMAVTVGDKATWDFVADPETAGAWHLTRDAEPVALLMPDGTIGLPHGPVDLLKRYQAHSRRMTPMIGEVFGLVLP